MTFDYRYFNVIMWIYWKNHDAVQSSKDDFMFEVNFAILDYLRNHNHWGLENFLPPIQAPNVNAHIRGCIGKLSSRFWARFVAILTIIVVSGTLSTKQLAKADTQSISNIATANRDSSLTDRIKSCVFWPIHEMIPKRERA